MDRFKEVLRRKLDIGPSALSEEALTGLWCALDVDDSSQVTPEEMAQFLKHGKVERAKKAEFKTYQANLQALPTAAMRAGLEAELTEEQLAGLSSKLNAWLEESLYKQNKSIHSWFNLFREADEDGSGLCADRRTDPSSSHPAGFCPAATPCIADRSVRPPPTCVSSITFDELVDVIRHKLKKGPSVLPDDTLKALWCHLDADDSNQIMPNEMGKFLKQTQSEHKSKGPANLNKKKIELGGSQTDGLGRALESTPTAEMRASLEAELTDDELTELSKQFNEWLEHSIYASNRSTHSWFNLFKEVDDDGSGFITFDEFEDVIRHKLKQPKKTISDARIKALWCALDADDSNQIMPQEMGKWLKRGAIEKKAKVAVLKKKELGSSTELAMSRALGVTPTSELRAKLEAEGVAPLTKDDLLALSKSFNEKLEQSAYNKNKHTHSWFNL